jgi:hypothetical protein
MTTIIQEIAQTISKNFEEELKKLMTQGKDISEFILETKKMMDQIGVKLVKEALESMDQAVKESNDRKRSWVVKSKEDPKSLSTIFGDVAYERTYYKNKKTGEFCYLSDEMVGIQSHDRMDASLKAKLVEEACDMAYSKSGQKATEAITLTSQTVMNSIRELGGVRNDAVKVAHEKKAVKVLFVEADEDHVANQKGGWLEPKLVYVHEGKVQVGKDRWELINARYFSGMYSNSDELWVEVVDYLDEAYDMDKVEKIYLSGDGARWIRNGVGWIKGSTYVLDRYHLSKYVTVATRHMPYAKSFMWEYINKGDKENLKELFEGIIGETEHETKKRAVMEARTYILNNWDGIRNQYQTDCIGCSAEGHVSHILSSRLSSRPLGWCRTGVDQMSRLRAFQANGGKVYDLFIGQKKESKRESKRIQIDKAVVRNRKLAASRETIGNLTILNTGKKTWAYEFLKSIRHA